MGYWKPQQQPTFHLGHCPGCQQLRAAQTKPAMCWYRVGGRGIGRSEKQDGSPASWDSLMDVDKVIQDLRNVIT